ncbi:MAG: cation transporter dimerization domain-containing protein, partial [Alphaproteobacteria bacterium]
ITAMLLAYESKALLIGEAADPKVIKAIKDYLAKRPEILGVNEVLTVHFGPQDVLLNLSVDFKDDISSAAVEATISEMERDIRAAHPDIRRIFIEIQSLADHYRVSKELEDASVAE